MLWKRKENRKEGNCCGKVLKIHITRENSSWKCQCYLFFLNSVHFTFWVFRDTSEAYFPVRRGYNNGQKREVRFTERKVSPLQKGHVVWTLWTNKEKQSFFAVEASAQWWKSFLSSCIWWRPPQCGHIWGTQSVLIRVLSISTVVSSPANASWMLKLCVCLRGFLCSNSQLKACCISKRRRSCSKANTVVTFVGSIFK